LTQEEFDEFKELVYTDTAQTEIECGQFLNFAAAYLIPHTVIELRTEQEHRNYFGSSDYIVTARVLNDQSFEEDFAYIWELKAPQCYLFERDENQNRCRPTKEFVKAENQLLQYLYSAVNDSLFWHQIQDSTFKQHQSWRDYNRTQGQGSAS
jgi:hypothetical protein